MRYDKYVNIFKKYFPSVRKVKYFCESYKELTTDEVPETVFARFNTDSILVIDRLYYDTEIQRISTEYESILDFKEIQLNDTEELEDHLRKLVKDIKRINTNLKLEKVKADFV